MHGACVFPTAHPLLFSMTDNLPPGSPESAPALVPTSPDKADHGCFVAMILLVAAVFAGPALLMLGGAPLIPVILGVLLLSVATPWVNPMEKSAPRALWTGRIITFFLLAALVAGSILAFIWFGFSSGPDNWDVRQTE